jgi:hypothetical protein
MKQEALKREQSIPDMMQFEKRTEIDVLLQEIIRIVTDKNNHPSI